MSEVETFHDSQAERQVEDEEVHFRENNPHVEISTPPTTITSNDLDVIIDGWEQKFEHLSQCMREIQLASEKANADMYSIARDGRARESIQERRIEEMHEGLTQFLDARDPRNIDPCNTDPRKTDSRNRDHHNTRDTRNRDHHDARDPRNQDHHDTRDRSRDHRSNERPTPEDDRGDSGDTQRNSYHSGMSYSMSRPSSSPKQTVCCG